MTLEQIFNQPMDTQEQCNEWLDTYNRWHDEQVKMLEYEVKGYTYKKI